MTHRGRELNCGSHTYLTTQGNGGPPRTDDQLNVGATTETAQTRKTIHARHTLIHSNKANMKWWLWLTNDIRGPCEPNVSWHLSYRWGKSPIKPRKTVPTEDRTRARCVIGANATACFTVVDHDNNHSLKFTVIRCVDIVHTVFIFETSIQCVNI